MPIPQSLHNVIRMGKERVSDVIWNVCDYPNDLTGRSVGCSEEGVTVAVPRFCSKGKELIDRRRDIVLHLK